MYKNEHRVWMFYDFYKTVRLNWKYYKKRLRQQRKLSNFFEILIAIATPGSAIAGFTFWSEETGKIIWGILGGVAALFSVVKPILKTGKKIELLAKVVQQYAYLDSECFALASDIKHAEDYLDKHYREYQKLLGLGNKAKQMTADEIADKKVIEALQDEVEREIPANKFFIPQEG